MNKPTSDPLGLVNTNAAATPAGSSARESAQLASLLALHNNAADRVVAQPEPQVTRVTTALQELRDDILPAPPAKPAPAFVLKERQPAPTPAQAAFKKEHEQVTHARSPFDPRLLFFSGVLKSGKDHVAAAAGATVFSLASPLYRMREVFFGPQDKDKWGAREFLQWAGQVGRGVVNEKYLLNAGRANFVMMVRAMGTQGDFGFPDVSWADFGKSENLWLDAMLKRVVEYRDRSGNEDKRCAVVNARFKNEVEALTAAGFTHWHVMCGNETWHERLKQAGLDPASPTLSDFSEQMALSLNRQASQASLKNPTRKLRCIWNDPKVPPPSQAFFTLNEFLRELEIFS